MDVQQTYVTVSRVSSDKNGITSVHHKLGVSPIREQRLDMTKQPLLQIVNQETPFCQEETPYTAKGVSYNRRTGCSSVVGLWFVELQESRTGGQEGSTGGTGRVVTSGDGPRSWRKGLAEK